MYMFRSGARDMRTDRPGSWDRGGLLRRGNDASPFSWKAFIMATIVTLPSP